MPQMMPLNWILLFIMFIFIFIMFNAMNYFSFKSYNYLNLNKKSNNIVYNWKW